MVNSISKMISAGLCKSGIIPNEDFELYAYGFFVVLSRLIFLIVTIIFGALFSIIWEGVLFYILFSLIRSYAGGIHAPKEWICTVLTSSFLFLSILGIKALVLFGSSFYINVLFAISFIIILVLSPLDTNEKLLKANEKRLYRVKTYVLLLAITLISVLMLIFNKRNYFYAGMISLVLESFLLLLGKISATLKNNIFSNQKSK